MFNRGSLAYKSSSSLGGGSSSIGGSSSAVTAAATSSRQHPLSLCADCGAQGPSWASINRGVLLCSECTSVHRSLGRHVSHVKSLRGGTPWIPEQLTMIQSLYSCGANSIWEYSLLNPGGSSKRRTKPSATDPLHPVKSDFIKAKYQQQAFVYKPAKDEPAVTQSDLSKQLHSSVRTPNLETSLRLISQGADPNYYHPEKNSTPLQVAAKAGQSGQVELLLVYGADPGAVDKMGRTAADYAKQSGHPGLANRINNSMFELSDRLTFFLCQKKPDHGSGHHFFVPEIDEDKASTDESRRVAKRRLQGLNNSVFEELAMDVYDEVDRRETDTVWAVHSGMGSSKTNKSIIIPFLPVNPEYGTTRNQGRQKLARLNAKEFSILVVDVLKEIRRRQTEINSMWPMARNGNPLSMEPGGGAKPRSGIKAGHTKSLSLQTPKPFSTAFSDDEPIYDHVASDDDYYNLPDIEENSNSTRPQSNSSGSRQDTIATNGLGMGSSVNSSPAKRQNGRGSGIIIGPQEYREMREKLETSEVKVQRLIESNDDMRGEIARLSATVSKLLSENENLKMSINYGNQPPFSPQRLAGTAGESQNKSMPYVDSNVGRYSPLLPLARSASSGSRSMPSQNANFNTLPSRYAQKNAMSGSTQSTPQTYSYYHDPRESGTLDGLHDDSHANMTTFSPVHHQKSTSSSSSSAPSASTQQEASESQDLSYREDQCLPSQEEVVRRTEAITRCIQELLISAKDEKFDAFIPCSERIVRAVTDMVVLFPEDPGESSVTTALSSLTAAATHFEAECRVLITRSQSESLNQSFVTQQVIQCAFDIAKSTKHLVALFQ